MVETLWSHSKIKERKGGFKQKLLLTFVGSALIMVNHAVAQSMIEDWDPNWNYEKGGDDWAFLNCNNTKQQQSPVDLKNPGINWWYPEKGTPFTFIPSYKASVLTNQTITNFTFMAEGDFG